MKSLNASRVRYLVVGGYAVAFHGHPRYTKDLDVWIESSPQNAARVVKALQHFGFGSLGLTQSDFSAPDQIIQLGNPPNRIDVLTSLAGVEFAQCYAARVRVIVEGIRVNVIDARHLKKNKRVAGRPQDLADVASLTETRSSRNRRR
ncbi:MAG: hypothetical protein HZC40_12310 [Chloroflexi bacterium]|nr:hypothetical protein [Chloroflexota bacterium]